LREFRKNDVERLSVGGLLLIGLAHRRMGSQECPHPVAQSTTDCGYNLEKSKGNCSWGAGILAHKGVCTADELAKKVSTGMVDQEFERRVAEAERYVRISVKVAVNQAQFDALVSLTYNAGIGGMEGTYSFINNEDFEGAAANIFKMIKVAVVEKVKRNW
jgi:GH24 family phage-related lysozyme (muramidase)